MVGLGGSCRWGRVRWHLSDTQRAPSAAGTRQMCCEASAERPAERKGLVSSDSFQSFVRSLFIYKSPAGSY